MEDASVALERLEAALRKSPSSFDFFQAVQVLETLRPDREPVGHFTDPDREVAKFGVRPSLAFPGSEIHSLSLDDDGPARMKVDFFGLTGPSGVLPHPYTQLVAERSRARDAAMADFLDLFHHRLISLFYRAWKKSRLAASAGDEEDRFRDHLFDLLGLGIESMRGQLAVPDESLAVYVGLLGPQARGAAALQGLVADFFDVPVQVEEFVGAWQPVPVRDQCSLGAEGDPSNQLGLGVLVGDEIWETQSRVRLRIGPLPRDRFEEFLPEGAAHPALRSITRFFGHDQFDFEVQLVLAREDVPPVVLGSEQTAQQPLGWTTWLRTAPLARDPDEAVFTLS
jgi:type VI secretion system protein ImpH